MSEERVIYRVPPTRRAMYDDLQRAMALVQGAHVLVVNAQRVAVDGGASDVFTRADLAAMRKLSRGLHDRLAVRARELWPQEENDGDDNSDC